MKGHHWPILRHEWRIFWHSSTLPHRVVKGWVHIMLLVYGESLRLLTIWVKSFIFGLVGLLEFKIHIYFSAVSKKAALYQASRKSFAYYSVHFLTKATLDKIWQSGKFHPDLNANLEKIIFLHLMRYENQYFHEDNCFSGFMADLAMGYYHEHSTMIGGLI